MKVNSFRDLEVWKKGRVIRSEVSTLSKSFPSEEKYLLVDQMVRASCSVTAHISDGYGRYHHQENIQFCRISKGSLMETLDHLTVALDEECISEEIFIRYESQLEICLKPVNGYINYLRRAKETPNNN